MEMTKQLPFAEPPIDGKRQSSVAHACAGGHGETAAVVRTVGGHYQQRIAVDSLTARAPALIRVWLGTGSTSESGRSKVMLNG